MKNIGALSADIPKAMTRCCDRKLSGLPMPYALAGLFASLASISATSKLPPRWRGGPETTIPKRKRAPIRAHGDRRGIVFGDDAKVKAYATPRASACVGNRQFGCGFGGHSTLPAQLTLQALRQAAVQRSSSLAMRFIDFK